MSGSRVVIIGGGVAGLASAALLAREGYDVTLLEAREEVGGRVGSWAGGGYRFDTGPSWYLMSEVFEHFFALLGDTTSDHYELTRLDPAYRVYFEGTKQPVDVPGTRAEVVDLFESLEAGAGAALEKYLESGARTYTIAMRRFLYTGFASWLPLLRGDVLRSAGTLVARLLQPLHSYISGFVTDPRLQQILGFPAVFLGSSPYSAPSMYHLMSFLDLDEGVSYPQGGFTRVVEALRAVAEREGVVIHTRSAVTAIHAAAHTVGGRRRRRTARVTGVEVQRADGPTETIAADVVVGATDLHHLETRLVPEKLRTYPERYWTNRDPGPGGLILQLGVRGRVPELAHHTLMFTRDWQLGFEAIFGDSPHVPDPASLYVCRPAASDVVDAGIAPEGDENLFVLVPVPADPGLGPGGVDGRGDPRVEALADAVITQISDWAGIDDLAERVRVRRVVSPTDFADDLNAWRGSLLGPAHVLRQSAMFRTGNRSRHIDGLYYVGASTVPGVGLPMCLISAEVLLKRLRGDTSTEPLPTPMPPRPRTGVRP